MTFTNIQRSLKNNDFGNAFIHLKRLYEKHELTNTVNRLVENMNHEFLLSVILERFKSHDLGSAKQILLHNENENIQTALYDIDTNGVINRLKTILEIKEKEELNEEITEDVLKQIKEYFYTLDLIRDVDVRYDDGTISKRVVFIQPGMRYSITKALVYSLMQDGYFTLLKQQEKEYIVQKILSDVKGRMLEDIVLLEASYKRNKNQLAFKYQFIQGGEYDLVIYDSVKRFLDIFEIKHSKEVVFESQTKYLTNQEMSNILVEQFGHINSRNVLYRGDNKIINSINYLNVEQFLINK